VRYRRVTPGALQEDGLRVIARGLNKGDWVAVGGLQQLRPGMVVKTDRKPMPSFGQPEGADGQGGEGRPNGKAP